MSFTIGLNIKGRNIMGRLSSGRISSVDEIKQCYYIITDNNYPDTITFRNARLNEKDLIINRMGLNE